MHDRRRAAVVAALVITLLWTPAATSEPDTALVHEELRGIREALEQLVAAEQVNERYRKIDLILKRIDLWVRRMAPMEAGLRATESAVGKFEQSLDALDRMRGQEEQTLEREIRDGLDSPASKTRKTLEDIERSRAGTEQRLDQARVQLHQQETDLLEGRREIENLDDALLDLLEE